MSQIRVDWKYVKFGFDLIIWFIVLIMAFLFTFESDKYSNAPLRFSFTEIVPYHNFKAVDTFFNDNVNGKSMCTATNTPATCDRTFTALLTASRTALDCLPSAEGLPRMCAKCVDIYTSRIHTYGTSLIVGGVKANIAADAKQLKQLKAELESCMMRESTWSIAKYLHECNVTVHLLLWASFALFFSICEFPDTTSTTSTYVKWGSAIIQITFSVVMAVVVATASSLDFDDKVTGSNPTTYEYTSTGMLDMFPIFIVEGVLFCLAVIPMVLMKSGTSVGMIGPPKTAGSTSKGTSQSAVAQETSMLADFTKRVMLFDSVLLVCVPSICVIFCVYTGLRDWDMYVFICTTMLTLVCLSLVDDVLLPLWTVTEDWLHIAQHTHVHIGIVVLSMITLLYTYFTDMPSAPFNDEYHASMQTGLFYLFVVAMIIVPAFLHEFTSKDAMEILHLKEGAEMVYRATVLAIMSSIFLRADTGIVVTA